MIEARQVMAAANCARDVVKSILATRGEFGLDKRIQHELQKARNSKYRLYLNKKR
jgi:hypothetical protein